MSEPYVVEPDVGFIGEMQELGGGDLKKCFQCATCSVACPIAPDDSPFPRKEMIAASWGLKDRVVNNEDVWLCHNCGDCSDLCPRGAKPGDVLAAARQYALLEFAPFKGVGKMVTDPKKLPILFAIPAVIFVVMGMITGLLDFTPESKHGVLAHADFFSTWLVDMIMIPTFLWMIYNFAMGLKKFLSAIHQRALAEGRTDIEKIDPAGFVKSVIAVIPGIFTHRKFDECTTNDDRATPHMMVFFGFVGLFIVTNIFFVVMYGFGIHGPYSQLNPVKWLGNISGIALVIGSLLLLKSRMAKKDQASSYKDWQLIWLAFFLGATGMLTQMTRLAGMEVVTYTIYFIHLIFVFSLFAYLPYSKLAHIVYRTAAMAYANYTGRKY